VSKFNDGDLDELVKAEDAFSLAIRGHQAIEELLELVISESLEEPHALEINPPSSSARPWSAKHAHPRVGVTRLFDWDEEKLLARIFSYDENEKPRQTGLRQRKPETDTRAA
jgi:hypothetical protein